MGMDIVLRVSEWSSLVLGTRDGCEMLLDVLIPVMAHSKVFPDLQMLLGKNNLSMYDRGKKQKTFHIVRGVTIKLQQ